jgi:hypothetical protein
MQIGFVLIHLDQCKIILELQINYIGRFFDQIGNHIGNLNNVHGFYYEFKPPLYDNVIEKNNCIHTNGMLENGLMYVY